MRKQYIHESVTYGFVPAYRKWAFTFGERSLITPVKGGSENAHKVARIIQGSLNRSKVLDGLARANIDRFAL